MLGKLLKYEMKSTSRIMWILYAATIIWGALLGIVLRLQVNFADAQYDGLGITAGNSTALSVIMVIFLVIYLMLLSAMMTMTFIMIILRFYRNLLSGEGYLMHTLPVQPVCLITSKLLIAILWLVIAGVAAILSGVAVGLTSGILIKALSEVPFSTILRGMGELFNRDTFLVLLMVFVGYVSQILQFYFAMAIGNLANRSKLLFSVLAHIGISILQSVVLVILMIKATHFMPGSNAFDSVMVRSILLCVTTGTLFFLGTNYILKNRLNLA